MRIRSVSLLSILAAVALVAGCGSSSDSGGGSGSSSGAAEFVETTPAASGALTELKWAQPEEPTSIDPAKSLTQTENPIVSNMCESLLRVTPELEIVPNLAESFENPNPRTWVYELRDDVKFWNGDPMTAEDVAYSLARHIDPEVGSYWALYYRNVASVEATGPNQVTVKLKAPDYVFNQQMATAGGAVTQKAAAEKAGAQYGSARTGVMCTGPLEFSKWSSGSSITLVKNEDYWNEELAANADRVRWSFLGDEATATSALTTGEVQGMYEAPISGISELRSSGSGELYSGVSGLQIDLIVTTDQGPMADPRVRKAIFLAADKDAIAETIFQDTALAAKTIINDDSWTYGDEVFSSYFDGLPSTESRIDEAKALIEEAGVAGQSITLAAENFATFTQLADIIAQSASEIGLDAKIKVLPPGGAGTLFFDEKARQGLDGFVSTWYTPTSDPLESLIYFLPDSVYNYSGFNNAELNRLIEKGYATADPDQRAEIAVQGLEIIDQEMPWVPIIEVANRLYMDQSVSGAPASFFSYLNSPWANLVGATE